MKIRFLHLATLALCTIAFAPWNASAISAVESKPTITWIDTSDDSVPIVSSGFSSSSSFNPIPGDGREQSGFTGTFFSNVDAQTFGQGTSTFGPASVWMVEPGSTTLSDWIGIDSLTRVENGSGWDYTIDMRFGSDTTSETQGNIPDPPSSPPWDAYPFLTETGAIQDITGIFRLNGPFPGYTAPAGLADLIQIFAASDVDEASNSVPDAGSSALLFALGLAALGLVRQRWVARI